MMWWLSLVGCGSSEPPKAEPVEPEPVAEPAPAAPAPEALPPKGEDPGPAPELFEKAAKPGDPPYTGKTHVVSTKEETGAIHPGDRVIWPISDSSSSMADKHRTVWSTPSGGDVLRYLFTYSPPGKPGSADINEHYFLAVKPGQQELTASSSSAVGKPVKRKPGVQVVGGPTLLLQLEVVAPEKAPTE